MRVVVALGGNALLRRGEAMTSENQRQNVRIACSELAPVAAQHELVIAHGNGPQVGLLALQNAAYTEVPVYPLDILGAETQGMIGYLVEQELGNLLPFDKPLATMLTMIEVDIHDPAFQNPSKPIGPIYDKPTADAMAAEKGWAFKPDGSHYRRVVPSPKPMRIFELRQIRWLLEKGAVVICAGGGGIPVMYADHEGPALDGGPDRQLVGVEAVIDKDHASGLLATGIDADYFIMATDADAAYVSFGTPAQRAIARAHPDALEALASEFAAGSMLPKVQAACEFARSSGHRAAIGGLDDISEMLAGTKGTIVEHRAARHRVPRRLRARSQHSTKEPSHASQPAQPQLPQGDRLQPCRAPLPAQALGGPQGGQVRGHGGAPPARQEHRPHLREDIDSDALCLRGGGLRPGCPRHVPGPRQLADGPQGVGGRYGARAGPLLRRHRVPRQVAGGRGDPGRPLRRARLQRPHGRVAPDPDAGRLPDHARVQRQGVPRALLRLHGRPALQHGPLARWSWGRSWAATCAWWVPRELAPPADVVKIARDIAATTGARITITDDAAKGVKGVDFIHTDVWVSMGEPKEVWKERVSAPQGRTRSTQGSCRSPATRTSSSCTACRPSTMPTPSSARR